MRKQQVLQISALGLLALIGASVKAAQSRKVSQSRRADVMILGVAHLESKNDVYNSVFPDSPFSPKRQRQIEDIIRRLLRFHPTKVLVEAPMDDPKIANRYQQFLAGQYVLPANETYQFGFKLAAQAKNSIIYPVDTHGPTLIEEESATGKRHAEFIKAHFEAHFADAISPPFKELIARKSALELDGTYLDLLRYLNTDAAIRANASIYSALAGVGRDAEEAGSAYVAQWYTRNCYIFSNILSVVRPGDRVVVIMGQGHEYLLREFVQLNPNLVFVDSLNYLK